MAALKRKTSIRNGLRAEIERVATETTGKLANYTSNLRDELAANSQYLKDSLTELKQLDSEILELIKEEEIENSVLENGKFASRHRVVIAKIDSRLRENTPTTEHVAPTTKSRSVKLPLLQLQKFGGNPTEWGAFWDSFSSAIHNSEDLDDVQKFNYLKSYLFGNAARALDGLAATSENYAEAVEMLCDRFGNKQVIISSHMRKFDEIKAVRNISDLNGLRNVYDQIESNVRSLQTVGVSSQSYENWLTPKILQNLPEELRISLMRTLQGKWSLDVLLKELKAELDIREQCFFAMSKNERKLEEATKVSPKQYQSTTASLLSNTDRKNQRYISICAFCDGEHPSHKCNVVSNHKARRDIVKRKGKCYVCLRSGHIARKCNSQVNCFRCRGRHHTALCESYEKRENRQQREMHGSNGSSENAETQTTTNMHVSGRNTVLLQTAQAEVSAPGVGGKTENIRLIFDSGSQKTYINERIKRSLNLKVVGKDRLLIKTFGDEAPRVRECEIVQITVKALDGMEIYIHAYVVPNICSPITNQVMSIAVERYEHLRDLQLADYTFGDELNADKPVDLLVGSDTFWLFVEDGIIRGEGNGPVAMKTKLGWVVSGPVEGIYSNENSHCFRVDVEVLNRDVDPLVNELHKFWETENVGCDRRISIEDEFEAEVKFENGRYEVKMPFKEEHAMLPDNYALSKMRLSNLLKKLKSNSLLAAEYQKVIETQLESGIIEKVNDTEPVEVGKVCYLPHKAVIRENKETTKVRVVFDASAKTPEGPSLNDCMHAGPSLLPKLMDILLRFRLKRVGLISDIEKAFLNISITPDQRNFLRFLWVDNLENAEPKLEIYRFTRVMFGAICSPYLLNATVRHHLEKYRDENEKFVDNVIKSLYCDDFVSSFDSDEEAFAQYSKLKDCFNDAGLNLRKWKSNVEELAEKIANVENNIEQDKGDEKVLGLIWDRSSDRLKFNFEEILRDVSVENVTKRSILSSTAKVFDPLGILSPVIIKLKILFQQLCKEKCDWDATVNDDVKEDFEKTISDLKSCESIEINRHYFSSHESQELIDSVELHGFSDASMKAYGSCVYIVYRLKTGGIVVSLVAAKTKVAPITGQTIPKLELSAAFILARLISNVKEAIETNIEVRDIICWSDSQIVLFWILRTEKMHKPFVQNRVAEIRETISPQQWRYCPTEENPADLASRGILGSKLKGLKLWWEGPAFLKKHPSLWPTHKNFHYDDYVDLGNDCESANVLRVNAKTHIDIYALIDISRFSCVHKVLRVIGLILRFIHNVKAKINNKEPIKGDLTTEEADAALNLLIKTEQFELKNSANYKDLSWNLGLFEDKNGILRCKGRIENASLPYERRFPILIPRDRDFAKLLVLDSHELVKHDGVKETLVQLRSRFWIVRGRQYVRKIIAKCQVCARYEGRSYQTPKPPPLPKFRLSDSAFTNIGIDFAGPVYVRNVYGNRSETYKAYILLITCASTRGVHLELVPDLGGPSLVNALSRFQARRGVPAYVISDNGKTFKDKNLQSYLRRNGIRWDFNVESCPWSGGFFERLVRSVKRCLRKTLRNSKLTYEEFSTILTEVEGVINSRPLTYGDEEVGEALTPSHLMIGRRIMDRPSPIEDAKKTVANLNVTEFTRRVKHLKTVLEHFRTRFRREYLTELREHQRLKRKKKAEKIKVGDVVTVFEDKIPRQRWTLGRIEKLLTSGDGEVRSAIVRINRYGEKTSTIRRPISRLYPVEFGEEEDAVVIDGDNQDQTVATTEPEIKFVADEEVDESVDSCL